MAFVLQIKASSFFSGLGDVLLAVEVVPDSAALATGTAGVLVGGNS